MMANRLTKLEFENKELKDQLAAKSAQLDKQGGQLDIYKKKPVKDIQDAFDRQVEKNKAMQTQIKEMEEFLLQYGLQWKGYKDKPEGELDVKKITEQLKDKPMYNYNLP